MSGQTNTGDSQDSLDDEVAEQLLFFHRSSPVYKIPPRAGLASYRAAEWVEPHAKQIATCRIKVLGRGKEAYIRLEEAQTGELFAETPVREPLDKYVEPVLDSSRWFVLRLEEKGGKNHAFVGIGFEDRSPAFDFNVALQDHLKYVDREKEEKKIDWGPAKDLSLKPGQNLSLNIKLGGKKSSSSASASASASAAASSGLSLSASSSAPGGTSKRRVQMEAGREDAPAQDKDKVRGVCPSCSQQVTSDHERYKDDNGVYFHQACWNTKGVVSWRAEGDWADFGDFAAALPASSQGEDGFGSFGDGAEGFGAFGDDGGDAPQSFGDFGDDADWAKAS